MHRTFTTTVCALCLVLGGSAALAQKGQKAQAAQTITADQLPQPVAAALAKSYPNASIVSISKMTRGTEARYQISLKPTPDAVAISVLASADGTLRAAKAAAAAGVPPVKGAKAAAKGGARTARQPEPVEIDQLPKPVLKTIKETYPKDTIISAAKVFVGTLTTFQVKLNDVSSVQPLVVTITSDGKIQKR